METRKWQKAKQARRATLAAEDENDKRVLAEIKKHKCHITDRLGGEQFVRWNAQVEYVKSQWAQKAIRHGISAAVTEFQARCSYKTFEPNGRIAVTTVKRLVLPGFSEFAEHMKDLTKDHAVKFQLYDLDFVK